VQHGGLTVTTGPGHAVTVPGGRRAGGQPAAPAGPCHDVPGDGGLGDRRSRESAGWVHTGCSMAGESDRGGDSVGICSAPSLTSSHVHVRTRANWSTSELVNPVRTMCTDVRRILALPFFILFQQDIILSCEHRFERLSSAAYLLSAGACSSTSAPIFPLRLRGGSLEFVADNEKGKSESKPKCLDSSPTSGVLHARAAALGDIARRAARSQAKRAARDEDFDSELFAKRHRSSDGVDKVSSAHHVTTSSSWCFNDDSGATYSPDEYRARNELTVKNLGAKSAGGEPKSAASKPPFELLDPIQDFSRAPFSPEILKTIRAQGFLKPSPIQAQCWPYLMAKFDVVAVASTGSGKTCG
jgi:hypothetical protein